MDRLLAVVFTMAIYVTLGWQGLLGAAAVLIVFHTAYRVTHGHWFGDM